MKLKKFLAGFAAAALMLSAGATTAFASDGWTGRYYLDADGDGVCDHCAAGGRGMGRGTNYVDADGDGVCDHCAAGERPQDGTGRANGFGGGRGR